MSVEVFALQKKEILPYIDDLAHLRITVFREYPYLYEGKLAYEAEYLQRFVENPGSVMVIACDRDSQTIVGASTGTLLEGEMPAIKAPFLSQHFELSQLFYFSESVLLAAYRGQGIGKQFFAERERAARSE